MNTTRTTTDNARICNGKAVHQVRPIDGWPDHLRQECTAQAIRLQFIHSTSEAVTCKRCLKEMAR